MLRGSLRVAQPQQRRADNEDPTHLIVPVHTLPTSSTSILLHRFPVPSHFLRKNCSTHKPFINWFAPLVTSKEGWCLYHRGIQRQTLTGKRPEMWLWEYSLFPCPHRNFLLQNCSPCAMTGVARCQICSSISSESRTTLAQHYALWHLAAFTRSCLTRFSPKHVKSAISTAAYSLPPTLPPSKS